MDKATQQFFLNNDIGVIYAPVGDWGMGGFLVTAPGAEDWDFIPPGSNCWDSLHQKIYRNSDCSSIDPIKRGFDLPPLPQLTQEQVRYPDPIEAARQEMFPAEHYPLVSQLLQDTPGAELTVFAVLEENLYETSSGDGCFRYLHEVLIGPEPPFEGVQTKRSYAYHARTLRLHLQDGRLSFTAFEKGTFDHHEPKEVLDHLEKRCSP